jgi:hypothetical protein
VSSQLDSMPRKVSGAAMVFKRCLKGPAQVTPWPWPDNPAPLLSF